LALHREKFKVTASRFDKPEPALPNSTATS